MGKKWKDIQSLWGKLTNLNVRQTNAGCSCIFFGREELNGLFGKFKKITIDRVIVTHENEHTKIMISL